MYYQDDTTTVYHADCLDLLPTLAPESVSLIFADPPYNIGKAAWDHIDDYLGWSAKWIEAASRVLKPNGAFWVCHSDPEVLVELSRLVASHGRKRLNWVTWDKYNGTGGGQRYLLNRTKVASPQGKRRMDYDAEYLIYHADEGEWTTQTDRTRGFIFEPLRAYLNGERERAGLSVGDVAHAFQRYTHGRTVTGAAGHWFGRAQWRFPTKDHYEWLRSLFNANGTDYLARDHDDLRREYDRLRQTFECDRESLEDLRYTFHNPGKVSSVWQFPPAPRNGHPTPKPVPLLERVISTCTNPGDVVLDPFVGSGTTLEAARNLGRQAIGCDTEEAYCRLTVARLTGEPTRRPKKPRKGKATEPGLFEEAES